MARATTISGGGLISKLLKLEAVEVVFGIIDGTYFGFYSSLGKEGIRLITPRHETSAAHMAGAYARARGSLGVCMASNGPGVANVLPGTAVENAEGNRVLLVTSSRRTGIAYPDRGGAYQYFDQTAVIKPMVKWNAHVPSFDRIPELVRKAFREAWNGRPGVVHLDVPEDIMNGAFPFDPSALRAPETYRRTSPIAPDPWAVSKTVEVLLAAKSPMIHTGSGVWWSHAEEEVAELAQRLSMPVTTSWAARGAVDEELDVAIPMLHVRLNHQVRNDADVVLGIGSRFGETDWWGKPPYWRKPSEQRLIQVDVDDQTLGMNKPVETAVLADARLFLRAVLDEVGDKKPRNAKERLARLAAYRAVRAADRKALDDKAKKSTRFVHPARVAPAVQRVFGDGASLVIDGGNTAIWANFYHHARVPGRIFSTFKFGMLGAGVAQALGAQVARPGDPVVCIIGDGAMGFQPQDVETAVRNKLPVTYIVLCDRQWGMVKMNQQFALKPVKTLLNKSLSPSETINADLGEIRFDLLGESMGAYGERVSDSDELGGALTRCRTEGRCAVVHVDVDPVAHMWAPGLRDFKDMHAEPKA